MAFSSHGPPCSMQSTVFGEQKVLIVILEGCLHEQIQFWKTRFMIMNIG